MRLLRLAILIALFASSSANSALAAERPNILILLADDLGWADLGCFDAPNAKTPNLDQLATEGMRLTDFHAAAPNCSPSRAGMLTGRVPARTGIYNYIPPTGPLYLPESETTIAELLRNAGYETAHVGKWHLCHDLLSDELPNPADHGFDHWMSTENNASPSHANPNNFVLNGKAIGPIEGYSCQIVADEAIRWMDEDRDAERPFFLCAWFHETHTPIASPKELIARYPNAKPADAKYYANVENMDAAVGRLLKALDERGLREDTFVLFSSDNGGLRAESNGPLRGKKSFVWEGGIREPGIIRWPGHVEPGVTRDEPAGFVDLLPTLCEITGVEPPNDRTLDGVSLTPLFDGERLRRKQPLFWFFYRVEPAVALRDGDWSLVGYLEEGLPASHSLSEAQQAFLKRAKIQRFELYNLAEDLEQQHDVSADHPERFEAMKEAMVRLHADVVAEGPTWTFGKTDAQ